MEDGGYDKWNKNIYTGLNKEYIIMIIILINVNNKAHFQPIRACILSLCLSLTKGKRRL